MISLLLSRIRAWVAYRKTYSALSRLDIPTLVDIGVPWADIGRTARTAALKVRG